MIVNYVTCNYTKLPLCCDLSKYMHYFMQRANYWLDAFYECSMICTDR